MCFRYRLGLALPLLLVIACTRAQSPDEQAAGDAPDATGSDAQEPAETPAMPDGHDSRNALDWAGTYSGLLPCASCPGIETVVTLRQDGTFDRSMLYIDESTVPTTESGTFTWNEDGGRITLASGDGDAQQYQVGENQLIHLDQDGEPITGDLAGQYVLHKHVHDPAIEDIAWRLVELRGQSVEVGQAARAAVLTLRAEDAVAAGNASCNTFSGPYAIKSGQRIRFGREMAVTAMACPDMSLESAFLEMLEQVDNYSVGDDGTLSLNRARMAPLARFEADEGA